MGAKIVCSWQFAVALLALDTCQLPILLVWIFFIKASYFKSMAINDKEIVQPYLPDILFEQPTRFIQPASFIGVE